MRILFSILSVFGVETEAAIDNLRRATFFNVAVAVCLLVAAIFLLVAGYIALGTVIGPLYAALAIAAGALVLGLIVHLLRHVGAARRERERARRRRDEAGTIATSAAVTAAPLVLRSGLGRILALPALAAVAYFALSRSRNRD